MPGKALNCLGYYPVEFIADGRCTGGGLSHYDFEDAEVLHDFGLQDRAIVITPVGCSVFACDPTVSKEAVFATLPQ